MYIRIIAKLSLVGFDRLLALITLRSVWACAVARGMPSIKTSKGLLTFSPSPAGRALYSQLTLQDCLAQCRLRKSPLSFFKFTGEIGLLRLYQVVYCLLRDRIHETEESASSKQLPTNQRSTDHAEENEPNQIYPEDYRVRVAYN